MTTQTHRVTHDFNDPAFPHGEAKGRARGCPCTPCREAMAKQKKRAKLLKTRYGGTKKVSPARQAKVAAHFNALLEAVPGASRTAVCRAAGVSHCLLVALDGARLVSPKTASRVLATTPEQVAAIAGFVPHARAVHHLRTMQALGYPMTWQKEQTGVMVADLLRVDWKFTTVQKASAIAALAARVGDTPATPQNTGLPQRSLSKAATVARMAGYYPPAYYDEDGTLDWRAIPDHPWSQAHDWVHRRIDLLRMIVEHDGIDMSRPEIAAACGEGEQEVTRLVRQFRLQLTESRRPKRIAWLRDQLDAFDANADLDPVKFALDLTLYQPTASFIPEDHPGFLAWREEHPEWQTATERKSSLQRERREQARHVVDLSTDTTFLADLDRQDAAA